jgi:Basic region leucine zipper
MPSTTVNPSLLSSLPSPSSSTDGPPRKRPRSELTSEERKEARAHRNRIAAQNSRDRRKAHYSQLEQRIAELEEENRQLKAGQMDFSAPPRRSEQEEQERDKARERENEELKERIKTLEKGWDAVVKALAAQGLPTGIPAPPSATTTTTTTTTTADSSTQPQPSSTFPVIVPNSSIFPISPASSNASLSTSSFDFEFDVVQSESTRHLARVATTEVTPPSMSLQRVDKRQINQNSLLNSRNTLILPLPNIKNQRQYPTQRWKISSARSLSRAPRPQRRLPLSPYLWSLLRPPPNSKCSRRPPRRR